MGLDINAYRNLIAIREATKVEQNGDDEPEDGILLRHLLVDDPYQRFGTLNTYTVYEAEDEIRFSAGSYRGYNEWRRQLAILAGYASDRAVWNNPVPGPFVELICFSDCEGVMDSITCAKLAKDFSDFAPQVNQLETEDADWFREKYNEWRDAFDMASQNGAVMFN